MAAKPKAPAAIPGFRMRLSQAIEQRLHELRKQIKGRLSVKTVAIVSGVDQGNLSKLLSGIKQHPSAETAYLLSLGLDVDLIWLIRGIEPSRLNEPISPELVGRYLAACTTEAATMRALRGSSRPDELKGDVESSAAGNALGAVGDDADE